jgi:hypothetical protein
MLGARLLLLLLVLPLLYEPAARCICAKFTLRVIEGQSMAFRLIVLAFGT